MWKRPSNLTCVSSRFERDLKTKVWSKVIDLNMGECLKQSWELKYNWESIPISVLPDSDHMTCKATVTIIKERDEPDSSFLCCFWDVCRGKLIWQDLFYSVWIVWNVPLTLTFSFLHVPAVSVFHSALWDFEPETRWIRGQRRLTHFDKQWANPFTLRILF